MRSNNSSSGRKGRGGSSTPKRGDSKKSSLDWRRKEVPAKSGGDKPSDSKKRERSDFSRGEKSENKRSFSSDKKRSEFSSTPYQKKKYKPKSEKPYHTKRSTVSNPVDPEKIRLNRYISNSGVCSRREADELIKMGLVSVNGKVITELGHKVNRSDEVRYEEKVLRAEKSVYVLINKPKGFITTTKDPQERKTIMHLIGDAVKERIYPVGRLDRNTTGLLLLTNDGELADKLMHPSYKAKKIYKVELDRKLTAADYQKILDGVRLEEGKAIVDDLAIDSEDGKSVGIELHIGWNRVIRRIFESLDYEVVKLDRTVYAGLDKKNLPRGDWRFLKPEEITRLKHFK